ncbi:MAG: molybdopterin-dependent oxidoreductase, partial [Acidimicrobiia bacterium]
LDVGLARSPVPLIVTHLDGEPLAHEHGGPIRLVVPGHYAMKSVKWLTRIEAVTETFVGHFVNRYRYRGDDEFEDGSPVGRIQVRSVIAQPEHGAELPAGKVSVQGSAWSGRGAIARVELSTDAGKTWEEASLRPGPDDLAAVAWSQEITFAAGPCSLMARATDAGGNTQPMTPRWNEGGYANNVVHSIRFDVV